MKPMISRSFSKLLLSLSCPIFLSAVLPLETAAQSKIAEPVLYPDSQRHLDSLFLEATTRYLTGKDEASFDTYMRLLEEDPQNATACFQLANILAERKNFSEALIYAEKACLLRPENPWFQLLFAQLLKTSRQFKKAAEAFGKLYELCPENIDYAYEQANMYVLLADLPSAIAIYDKLEQNFGISDTWTMQKYKLYNALKDTRSAIREIEAIQKEFPSNPKYLEMLAQSCMQQKEYKQAYSYLKKVLEIKPDDPYIHVSLADYYRNVGNFKQAYHSLEKAVQNPKLDFQTKLNVLRAYYTSQDELKPQGDLIAQALKLFDLLCKTHPNEAEGFFTYAKFLIVIDKTEQAVPLLEKAVKLEPKAFSSWDLLLLASHQISDTARISRYAPQAAAMFPEQASPYMYQALTAFLAGDYRTAAEHAEKSRKLNAGYNKFIEKISVQILGDAYFELEDYERSLEAYERLLEIDPDDLYVKNNYAYYLCLTGKDLGKARSLAEIICKEEPGNSTFLDTYGWILFQMGDYRKAADYLKKAIEHGGDQDATILEHYGDVLYRLGENNSALSYWEKAIGKQNRPDPNLEMKILNAKGTEK